MGSGLVEVARWLRTSQAVVVFTGAGMSTESGIPDFRSPGGIWAKYRPVEYGDFLARAEARYDYWAQKCEGHRHFAVAQPNVGHRILADWETAGRIRGVITQNIDGLHAAAGQAHVLELHGTGRKVQCVACVFRDEVDPYVEKFLRTREVPQCPDCGFPLKHATVSFGQSLPVDVWDEAVAWSQQEDLFLALGSSLQVRPAADLPVLAQRHGARLVIINQTQTPLDERADAVFHTSLGAALEEINALFVG